MMLYMVCMVLGRGSKHFVSSCMWDVEHFLKKEH